MHFQVVFTYFLMKCNHTKRNQWYPLRESLEDNGLVKLMSQNTIGYL
jgi:hypothetical protein